MNKEPIKAVNRNFILVFGVYTAAFGAFFALLYAVHSGSTLDIDQTILRFINQSATHYWNIFYQEVTKLGGSIFVTALTAALALWLINKKTNYLAAFVFINAVGAGLLNAVVKLSVGRERPSLWQQLIHEQSYSFPSGHAMNSATFAISAMVLCWPTRWRWMAVISSLIYMTAVGYSRIYLGVHYPTDILGGWLLSALWALFVTGMLYGYYQFRKRKTDYRQVV